MNGVNFRYGKYMNGSCFSLGLVYEWGGVWGLQPHIRTQNHGKWPPRDFQWFKLYWNGKHRVLPCWVNCMWLPTISLTFVSYLLSKPVHAVIIFFYLICIDNYLREHTESTINIIRVLKVICVNNLSKISYIF